MTDRDKAAELLACPFCGSDDDVEIRDVYNGHHSRAFVFCKSCGVSTKDVHSGTESWKKDLVKRWNTRADTATWNAAIRAAAEEFMNNGLRSNILALLKSEVAT